MAENQIFNGETDRLGTPLVGVATPTPLMNCCFAGNTNFLVNLCYNINYLLSTFSIFISYRLWKILPNTH